MALGSDPSSEELLATALTAQVKEVAEDVESSGWILKGWPATELQAKMLEFVLEATLIGRCHERSGNNGGVNGRGGGWEG